MHCSVLAFCESVRPAMQQAFLKFLIVTRNPRLAFSTKLILPFTESKGISNCKIKEEFVKDSKKDCEIIRFTDGHSILCAKLYKKTRGIIIILLEFCRLMALIRISLRKNMITTTRKLYC